MTLLSSASVQKSGSVYIINKKALILFKKGMLNFEFKNPTKIIFGKGQISRLTAEIPSGAKVLMLYGGGSIKSN